MVQVPETVDENSTKDTVEIINALADRQCTCREGEKWRNQEAKIESAKEVIEAWTNNVGEQTAGGLLMAAVEPAFKGAIKQMQITTEKGTYTMKMKDGDVNLTHKETIINEIME
jgi:hypothetical protein